jgi:peptide/nickel transport system substrate-binding protein
MAGKLDSTFPYQLTVPLLKDVKSQMPEAICELRTTNSAGTLIINRSAPPFDNPDLRRALALSLDRRGFIDILSEGQDKIGAALLPPPEGVWGMPADMLSKLPGYDPDVAKNRAEARKLMEKLGWGPGRRLKIKAVARNVPSPRDPAVILIGQLKEIYIDAELDAVETANW